MDFEMNGSVLVKYIGQAEEVIIPEDVHVIGTRAFEGCTTVKAVTFPGNLGKIRPYAFARCTSLEEITIPKTVNQVSDGAFQGCSMLKKVIFEGDRTVTTKSVFRGCVSLKEVRLPMELKVIGARMFQNCRALQKITLPEGLGAIETLAFVGCGLETLYIPDGVNVIAERAFGHCKKMREVSLPNLVQKQFNRSASRYVQTKIEVRETGFKEGGLRDFIIYKGRLLAYRGKQSEVVIPYGVIEISKDVFYNQMSLEKVVIPDSLENISRWTFSGCPHVKLIASAVWRAKHPELPDSLFVSMTEEE